MEEFGFRYPKLGIRHSWCKPCFVEYKQLWYIRNRPAHIARVRSNRDRTAAENRFKLWQYLVGKGCVDCGERDPVVLQFDHLRDKRNSISEMIVNGWSWETIRLELGKCEIRCANCHQRKTAVERGYYARTLNGIIENRIGHPSVPDSSQRAVSSMDRASAF